jgi:hypothetical protein
VPEGPIGIHDKVPAYWSWWSSRPELVFLNKTAKSRYSEILGFEVRQNSKIFYFKVSTGIVINFYIAWIA